MCSALFPLVCALNVVRNVFMCATPLLARARTHTLLRAARHIRISNPLYMIFTVPSARAQPLSYKLRSPLPLTPATLFPSSKSVSMTLCSVPCLPCCSPAPAPTRSISPLPSNPSPKCLSPPHQTLNPNQKLYLRASPAAARLLTIARSNPAVTLLIVGLLFSRLTIATIMSGMTRCVRAPRLCHTSPKRVLPAAPTSLVIPAPPQHCVVRPPVGRPPRPCLHGYLPRALWCVSRVRASAAWALDDAFARCCGGV